MATTTVTKSFTHYDVNVNVSNIFFSFNPN